MPRYGSFDSDTKNDSGTGNYRDPDESKPKNSHHEDHIALALSLKQHLGMEKAISICKQNGWQAVLDALADMTDDG